MGDSLPVYNMFPSGEDHRPQIDLEKHGYSDEWKELARPFPERVEVLQSNRLAFNCDASDALDWDWYWRVGMWGMWSQRAKDLLWPYARKHLRCFLTTLNDQPYYILHVDKKLAVDCLDRERSDLEFFKSDPASVKRIRKYVFKQELLTDPLVFNIPEVNAILSTRTIRQMVFDAGLKGFHFEDAEHPRW
jgi:hypothetical protein